MEKNFDYDEKECIHFKNGLFGFEEYKKYLAFPVDSSEKDTDRMLILHIIDNMEISFVIMNPFYFLPNYHPTLSEQDKKELDVVSEEDLSWYVMCTIHNNLSESVVNLKCPIVVNIKNRKGKQLILDDEKYKFRHKIAEFERNR